MSKTTILNEYLEFKKTSVKSEKIKDIERYLAMFINSTNKTLNKLTEKDIAVFLNSLNYSIRTINDIKAYLKSFIKWYFKDWSSKFRNLDKLLKKQLPPKAYTPNDMISYNDFEKIVKVETNLQWKVFWLVLFYGGFRPSEACRLKWENIFFEQKGVIIKVRTTKTKKDFIKSLPKEAQHKLKELKQNSNSEYLFPSPYNNQDCIRARTVCVRLKRISKKALGKVVVPYQLRHSIATILYSDDKLKDDDIAQQLGHTKNMREIYKNMNEEQIKEKARKLWGKPITKEEKEDLLKLRKDFKDFVNLSLDHTKLMYKLIKKPDMKGIKELQSITEKIEAFSVR